MKPILNRPNALTGPHCYILLKYIFSWLNFFKKIIIFIYNYLIYQQPNILKIKHSFLNSHAERIHKLPTIHDTTIWVFHKVSRRAHVYAIFNSRIFVRGHIYISKINGVITRANYFYSNMYSKKIIYVYILVWEWVL